MTQPHISYKTDISTFALLFVTVISFGMFLIYWIGKATVAVNESVKREVITDSFMTLLCMSAGIGAAFIASPFTDLAMMGLGLTFLSWIMYVVWAFKARSAIKEYALNEHKIDYKMNGFYTVIFNTLYINYCINDLEEVIEKKLVLSGEAV